jgi:YidC/Oxa1 family membrane protein insertase
MYKKLFFFSLVGFILLFISACGGQDPVHFIAVNNPTAKLIYEHNEANSIVFRSSLEQNDGLSYWAVTKSGASATLVNYEGPLPSSFTTNDDGVRTYTFDANGQTASFQLYIKPEVIVGDLDDIVMVVLRYSQASILLPIGQEFNPEGIVAYVVRRGGGEPEVVRGSENPEFFNDHGYTPLGPDGFYKEHKQIISFEYEGYAQEFQIYVAGGERPIHTEDATFFDWILVIPVAFLTSFFASLFGNNFALGILFTTLIVRTLAWPIYAKSNDMSIKMNIAQPDMQRVQAKYATKKDPQSQQMMQMEMMQVYKKHGISILGCLVPFMQMPIFIAMYGVVRRITLAGGVYTENVSNTMFLGINLSNQNDGIIGMFLAGIVGVTMFILQYISMKKPSYVKNTAKHNPNPQAAQTEKTMKYISYFMVMMMVFISFQSNALAIYWIFGNIYSLGQTIFNRKLNEKKHAALQSKQLMG